MNKLWILAAAAAGAGLTYYLLKRNCGCHAAAASSSSSSAEPTKAITVADAPMSPNLFQPGAPTTSSLAGGCTDCGAMTARVVTSRAA